MTFFGIIYPLVYLLPLVGPPKAFPTVLKNSGAERRRFWHSLFLINFAPFLKILGLGHIRSGHQTRSSDPTSKNV